MSGAGGPEPVVCEICGRPLKTKRSRQIGRGRTCDEKVNPDRGRDHSPQKLRVGRIRTGRPPAARAPRTATPPPVDEPTLLDVLEDGPP